MTDRVTLLLGGHAHADWLRYEVDSDLLTPADAWSMTLALDPAGTIPAAVRSGEPAELRVDGNRVMMGRVDSVLLRTRRGQVELTLEGRDNAGQLLDCSAPVFTSQNLTLDDVVAKLVKPLGVTKIRIDAANSLRREKVSVEPGDSAWDALAHAAEANGLWPWFEPDGTLVVGGPDYNAPPVATLIHDHAGRANNVLELNLEDSLSLSHSEVTVLAQTHGGGELRIARNGIRATYTDPSVRGYRPRVVVDHESDTPAHARERARKLTLDSRLARWELVATVPGHCINAPGQPAHGMPWTPGMRVAVQSRLYGLHGIYFLLSRTMSGGRGQPTQTRLSLKEDGVWIVNAHPHKRRHRRGKNAGPGVVLDISNKPEAARD
jgi:prophage tail gpP-like protein